MKLFGRVSKTRPGWDEPIGGYPYRGWIYNEYGELITTEVGGMTEEACKEAIKTVGQQIYRHQFADRSDIFEIEELPVRISQSDGLPGLQSDFDDKWSTN